MVGMLQNILHYTGDYMSKENSILSSSYYPEQNSDFLDKLLLVPFRNENDLSVNFRLPVSKKQFPLFNGHKGPYDNYTRVLRFDLDAPYKAILVDPIYNIVVCDTRELLKYKIYPRYRYNRFRGFDEARLPMTSNWDEFNEEYNSEKMWIVHVQDQEMIGKAVYLEYFSDIISLDHGDSMIGPSPRMSENVRHGQDYLDNVYRAKEQGYIIRADEGGPEAEIVAMVVNEDGTKKYVLGSEAYMYIDVESHEREDISELGLWQ